MKISIIQWKTYLKISFSIWRIQNSKKGFPEKENLKSKNHHQNQQFKSKQKSKSSMSIPKVHAHDTIDANKRLAFYESFPLVKQQPDGFVQ